MDLNGSVSWRDPSAAVREMWYFSLDQTGSSASRIGVCCCQGVCSCSLPEFPEMVGTELEETEQWLQGAGLRSQSPEDVRIRIESIGYCLRLLGRLPEDQARALLAYYSGDRKKFASLTGINNKRPAEKYVAELVATLALAADKDRGLVLPDCF